MRRSKLPISSSRTKLLADPSNNASQGVTLAIAVLGAALGLINTWRSWVSDRPRARIRYLFRFLPPDMEQRGFTIEVTNLSTFDLTIQEVGFSLSPFWKRDIERLFLVPDGRIGDTLPILVKSRQQANFCFLDNPTGSSPKRIKSAYAKTACGVYFRGVTPALRDTSRRLRPTS